MYEIRTTRILNYLFRETLTRQIVQIYSNFNKHSGEQTWWLHIFLVSSTDYNNVTTSEKFSSSRYESYIRFNLTV